MKRAGMLLLVMVCACGLACRRREVARDERATATAPAHATATATAAAPAVRAANPAAMPAGFLKGQLHTHTSRSADSDTGPHDVHQWYESRGYDFVVFTDHNAVTDTSDTHLLTIR